MIQQSGPLNQNHPNNHESQGLALIRMNSLDCWIDCALVLGGKNFLAVDQVGPACDDRSLHHYTQAVLGDAQVGPTSTVALAH